MTVLRSVAGGNAGHVRAVAVGVLCRTLTGGLLHIQRVVDLPKLYSTP